MILNSRIVFTVTRISGFCSFAKSAFLFGFISLFACNEPGRNLPDQKPAEADAGLPGGHPLELDSIHSEIRWTIRRGRGNAVSGVFRPGRGMLLLEDHSVVAGFWEGDLRRHNFSSGNQSPSWGPQEIQFMKDSIPEIFAPGGSLFRMDLKQVSRVIPKSEFKGGSQQDSLLPSHDVSFEVLLADSSRSLSIPLRIRPDKDQTLISGRYQLNMREFGILHKATVNPSADSWIPEASLEFLLRFRSKTMPPGGNQGKKKE